jgi:hypothetical protein
MATTTRLALAIFAALAAAVAAAASAATAPSSAAAAKQHGPPPPPPPAPSCADLQEDCLLVTRDDASASAKFVVMTLSNDGTSVTCTANSMGEPDPDSGCDFVAADGTLQTQVNCPYGYIGTSMMCTEIVDGGDLNYYRLPAASLQSYFRRNYCALPSVSPPAPGESRDFYFYVACQKAYTLFGKDRPEPTGAVVKKMDTMTTKTQKGNKAANAATNKPLPAATAATVAVNKKGA